MSARNLVRIALQSILKNKLRSFLTTLGIIIGVGAVIALVAVGQGAQAQIRQSIEALGTNLLVITPGSSSQGGVSRGAGSFNRLQVEDAEKIRRESLVLSAVSPVVLTFTQAVGGEGNWRCVILGVSTDYQIIRDWPMESGVFFDEDALRSRRRVALLGHTVAEELFPGQDPVGQQVRLRNVPFQIIGVLAPKGQTADGSDQDDLILAPYTTVRSRLSGHQFIAQILASTSSPQDIPEAEEEIRGILRESHGLADWEEDDFTVRNQTQIAEAAQGSTEVMTLLLGAIASISLLVGGIGIMNIMLVSVTERTHEIGLRLALGARGSDVLTQFLVESVVMCLLGGLLGVASGVGAAAALGQVTGWSTMISPRAVAVALGFSAAVGIFFGFYPARRAARLDPIEALRYE
jgi:putative ABC transport system permease protein